MNTMSTYGLPVTGLGIANAIWSLALTAYAISDDRRQRRVSMNKLVASFAALVIERGRQMRDASAKYAQPPAELPNR